MAQESLRFPVWLRIMNPNSERWDYSVHGHIRPTNNEQPFATVRSWEGPDLTWCVFLTSACHLIYALDLDSRTQF